MSTEPAELPESPTSKDIGLYLEREVADRLGFEHVEDDCEGHVDAYTPAGDAVEVKGARQWIADGSSRRRGHWWIQLDNHTRLLQDDGFYALVVYCRDGTRVSFEHIALVPARFVDVVIDTWTTVGDGHVDTDAATRVPWSRLFNVDGGDPGGE